jgi:hypothetical protein
MGILNTLTFLLNHPLSQGRRLTNLRRFVAWQIGARLVPGPVVCDFANGAWLLARSGLTGATGNVYVGLHEFEDMAFVLHFLRAGDLFVDVGANIGSYTILAAMGVGADCIAFEPGVAAFGWLERNVRLNGVSENRTAPRRRSGSSGDRRPDPRRRHHQSHCHRPKSRCYWHRSGCHDHLGQRAGRAHAVHAQD